MQSTLSEQEIIRRESLEKLRELGIDPYPAALYPVSHLATDIKSQYKDGAEGFEEVCLAGRLMMRRIMGKASFAELLDSSGRIQLYVSRDDICPDDDKTMYNTVFKKLLDTGDFIGVKGFVFTTKVGETTLHVKELTVLSKSIKPLPIVKTRVDEETGQQVTYDAFTDPELRYRQRYLDLVVNPAVKEHFTTRTMVIKEMRKFFDERGWMEVETPILQPVHGGAAARPFATHHNTLDMQLFMRIANELYLKRLIVGGYDGVYEIGKMFRNEGMDRTHNPEFTAMEIYVAYKDYIWMMEMVEQLINAISKQVTGGEEIEVGGDNISLTLPFRRLPMLEGIEEYAGVNIEGMDADALRQVCRDLAIDVDPKHGKGKLIDAIFAAKVEPHLLQPTYITDYPIELSPLAKKHRSKEGLVERYELFINRQEIANAYSELNDPIDQRARFEDQLKLAAQGDDEAMAMDLDFVRALEYGMPPTSGLGIGIDRLVMLLTNQTSIQEVIFFPQMKKETGLGS